MLRNSADGTYQEREVYHVDDVEVKIGDTCLEKQNCVKYLEVKIDS